MPGGVSVAFARAREEGNADHASRVRPGSVCRTIRRCIAALLLTQTTDAQQRHHPLVENIAADDVANLVAYLRARLAGAGSGECLTAIRQALGHFLDRVG